MSINEIFNMYFGIIEDERDQANVKHSLVDILKLVMLAVLCGINELKKILQLKVNQGKIYNDVYAMFDDKYMDEADKDCEYETFSTLEKNQRRYLR